MGKIIGIVGLISAGKDTAADVLIKKFGYQKESFSHALKDTVSTIFGWDREMLTGSSEDSRAWREEVDPFWAKELNIPNFTPRYALQNIGTDIFRNHFHNDIWVLSLKKRLASSMNNIVLSDCRYQNEIQMIKDMKGTLIHIKRGPYPEWFDLACDENVPLSERFSRLDKMGIHSSEYSWVPHLKDVTITINNNDDMESFKKNVFIILKGKI